MPAHFKSTHQAETDSSVSVGVAALSPQVLAQQNRQHLGTCGVSKGNTGLGFLPAFIDQTTGIVYLSRFANGNPAPLHLLDGLPQELVAGRSAGGCVTSVKPGVIAGFSRAGLFYTREQAARAVVHPVATRTAHVTTFVTKGALA